MIRGLVNFLVIAGFTLLLPQSHDLSEHVVVEWSNVHEQDRNDSPTISTTSHCFPTTETHRHRDCVPLGPYLFLGAVLEAALASRARGLELFPGLDDERNVDDSYCVNGMV